MKRTKKPSGSGASTRRSSSSSPKNRRSGSPAFGRGAKSSRLRGRAGKPTGRPGKSTGRPAKAEPLLTKAEVDAREKPGLRLNKYLANAGIASRRKADELIESGVVKVNGKVVTELGMRVGPGDSVTVKGDPISYDKLLTYILLNKPKDCITTSSDEKGRTTVLDVVKSRERVFPVGRLDRNSTGVLLLTNDGDLAYRLTHPKFQVPRVYKVRLDKGLQIDDLRAIAGGIELDDGPTQPCDIAIDSGDRRDVVISLTEGRNREVRRIFEARGYLVRKLDRKIYATLSTRGMARGEFRHLTRQEIRELEQTVGLDGRDGLIQQHSRRRQSK